MVGRKTFKWDIVKIAVRNSLKGRSFVKTADCLYLPLERNRPRLSNESPGL